MKLSDLAKKAASLPDLSYNWDWAGPERCHDYKRDGTLDGLFEYVDLLKARMIDQSDAIHKLSKAYVDLKEIILDASVEDDEPKRKSIWVMDGKITLGVSDVVVICKKHLENLGFNLKSPPPHPFFDYKSGTINFEVEMPSASGGK